MNRSKFNQTWDPYAVQQQEDWRTPSDYRRTRMMIIAGVVVTGLLALFVANAYLARKSSRQTGVSNLLPAPHKARKKSEKEMIMRPSDKRQQKELNRMKAFESRE
jgi:hypothetical protein